MNLHLSREIAALYEIDLTGSIGVVMGSEAFGLSSDFTDDIRCTKFITIPKSYQSIAVDSLNVSSAAAVILSEVARQRSR